MKINGEITEIITSRAFVSKRLHMKIERRNMWGLKKRGQAVQGSSA